MKKKLCAALVFAGFASLAFAQYGPPPSYGRPNRSAPQQRYGGGWMDFATYFSANFAAPIQWYQSYGDRDVDARTVNLGLGIDLTTFLTRRAGLHLSADLYFPQKMDGWQSTRGASYPIDSRLQEDWDSDWGLSVFAGPSFALIRGAHVVLAFAPGLHYYMLFAEKGQSSVFQYAIGVGANAELMFNVGRAIFLRAAVDATWDFWGSEEYFDGWWTEYSKIDRAISITPQVGIGIRL